MKKTWDQRKYNHWLKRIFLERFLKTILEEIRYSKAKTILDLGCGEGYPDEYFFKNLPGLKLIGIDKNENLLKNARKKNPGCFYQTGNILNLPFKKWQFDLVLVMEVLEHMRNPEKIILQTKKIAPKAIYTVPFEPWFSFCCFLSGNYLSRLGRHPDHLNFWNKRSFKQVLDKFFRKVKIRITFPWLIAVCEK